MFRPACPSTGTRSLYKGKRKSCVRHYMILSKFGCKLRAFCLSLSLSHTHTHTHTHTHIQKQNL